MKLISENEKEIGTFLNDIRVNSYLDIYLESEFLGKGYILTSDLKLYYYGFNIAFSPETHNFGMKNFLYLMEKEIDIKKLKKFLDLVLVKSNSKKDKESDEEVNSCVIVRLDDLLVEKYDSYLFNEISSFLLN